MKTKICTYCDLEKSLVDFYKCKKSKTGYLSACKKCTTHRKNLWRDKKKGKITQYDLQGRRIGRGRGYIHKNGYRYLTRKGHPNAHSKQGRIGEHQYIMSQYLGRPLTKTETVHHKNGIKYDNRIENLELWESRHGPGQRVKDKIDWCIAFLSEYGYKVIKE